MKRIAELQQEIRSIRKELSTIDNRLDAMNTELLNYKDVTSDNSEYKRIYEIAKTMPVIKHPVIEEHISTKNNYFGILLMIATVDDSLSEEQLLFLQRMVLSDLNNSRLDYYLGSLGTIQRENVLFKMEENVKTKLAEQLLLDMMILANLTRGVSRNAYEIIASIASFVGKNKDCLTIVSKVASAMLRQDISGLLQGHQETIDINNRFGFYLTEINGWKEHVAEASLIQYQCEVRNYQGREVSQVAFFHMSEEEEYGESWYYYKD